MSNELLPCPFCGQALTVNRRKHNPYARCETIDCKASQLPILNLDMQADIDRWNSRPQAAPAVTCNTATDNSARYNRAEELQLRLLQVVDLASHLATDAFEGSLDDPLESFVEAILDLQRQHPSLDPLADVLGQPGWEREEWESKRDHEQAVLRENAYDARMVFHGFGVQFGTPVRKYHGSADSYSYSWGYYNTVWIYAETLEQAWRLGCLWAEQKHRMAREKAGISEGMADA
ncbi:TPA: hypothetical protein L4W52_000377 [Pseudomonas aeruginosa]|nr:hypothetical protein [Pseudomonas aeruginosa]